MPGEAHCNDGNTIYPFLIIPRWCATHIFCDADIMCLNLKITSRDVDNNVIDIYSGNCNVQVLDNYSLVPCNTASQSEHSSQSQMNNSYIYNEKRENINHSHVYNNYSVMETQQYYSVYETSRIILEEVTKSYFTHNVGCYSSTNSSEELISTVVEATGDNHSSFFNHPAEPGTYTVQPIDYSLGSSPLNLEVNNYDSDELDASHYSPSSSFHGDDSLKRSCSPEQDFQHKKFRKSMSNDRDSQKSCSESDEISYPSRNSDESSVSLDTIVEEIRENTTNNIAALDQLMSPAFQNKTQNKTIVYAGENSSCGKTIQNISVSGSPLNCNGSIIDTEPNFLNLTSKKYQCDKCKQIFDQIKDFNRHRTKDKDGSGSSSWSCGNEIKCTICCKCFKSIEKYQKHHEGHRDSERECSKCYKVFATKHSLKVHQRLHIGAYPCLKCTRAYDDGPSRDRHIIRMHSKKKHGCMLCFEKFWSQDEVIKHLDKKHMKYLCTECCFITRDYNEFTAHKYIHGIKVDSDEEVFQYEVPSEDSKSSNKSEGADVMMLQKANEILLMDEPRRQKKHRKNCTVCGKWFDRLSDMKRHLIEHIVKMTLEESAVNSDGTFSIVCVVCHRHTFGKVDAYKAHLREHAKLTTYKCLFCDKSFSDSSNFSKHKKTHGSNKYQCDLCQRKFTSKKTITEHMELHMKSPPVECEFCRAKFYFPSMLNKHIKNYHQNKVVRFPCRFCKKVFPRAKDKWDHEWKIHHVSKTIVECEACNMEFRQKKDLRKHIKEEH